MSRPASSEPVSTMESHVGFWLRFVSNHVSGRFRRMVEARGVSVSDWVALRHLYGAGKSSAGDLTKALGMTKGAVSKIVGRLEEKGLVSRIADDADGRAHHLALTAAGRRLVPRLAELADCNDEMFFGHLSPEARGELIAAMQEVVRLHRLGHVPVE